MPNQSILLVSNQLIDMQHIINTAWQARELIERIGSGNIFIHLDTYHMNIEEKGAANGILAAREYLKYIHLSESDRGTPGEGCCDWDEIFATLAAINFKGGLAMESFINMPPEISYGLSIWMKILSEPILSINSLACQAVLIMCVSYLLTGSIPKRIPFDLA